MPPGRKRQRPKRSRGISERVRECVEKAEEDETVREKWNGKDDGSGDKDDGCELVVEDSEGESEEIRDLKKRLRPNKVYHDEDQGDDGFSWKRSGRKRRKKGRSPNEEGEEDTDNRKEDDELPGKEEEANSDAINAKDKQVSVKKPGTRGRQKSKVPESQDREDEDVNGAVPEIEEGGESDDMDDDNANNETRTRARKGKEKSSGNEEENVSPSIGEEAASKDEIKRSGPQARKYFLYPKISEDDIAEACPFCQGKCKCKACLRKDGPLKMKYIEFAYNERVQHAKYLLQALLPYIKQFSEEQMTEKVIEAKIHGSSPSHIHPQQAFCSLKECVYCDNCRTSIVDFHRSCPKCNYDLCLTCGRGLRDGSLNRGEKEVIMHHVDRGFDYLHGKLPRSMLSEKEEFNDLTPKINDINHESELCLWKANEDGSIPCPPKDLGGCGDGLLELGRMFEENAVVELVEKAERIAKDLDMKNMSESLKQQCSCYNYAGEVDIENGELGRAASRENSNDNYLRCLAIKDIQNGDLEHFQKHWAKGEPVIVSDVLNNASGLCWEPMVMSRAFHQIS